MSKVWKIQRRRITKLTACVTLCLYLLQPGYILAAGVVADPNAAKNKQPIVDRAANGTVVVQIAAPSAAGLSHNLYQDFNVDTKGLILNNASLITSTKLAGYITGNPNLAGGSAKIILNEVTGTNQSSLNGYIEITGSKADLIIANPNGITGNGFGFINAGRTTLTTGTPIFGGSGSLEAFRVTSGQIAIQGNGLDGNDADRVDLISQATKVNAGIWAKELNVVTGNNQVNYNDLSVQKLSDANTSVALDVGQLGGMYAGKIKLIGTAQGVGVNSQGTISALGGDLIINQAGKVVLTGSNAAIGDISLVAKDQVVNQGILASQQNLTITAQGSIVNTGIVTAGQNTALTAETVISNGSIGAGIQNDGSLGTTGNLNIQTNRTADLNGQNLAGGNLLVQGTALDLSGAKTSAGGNVSLIATAGDIDHTGAILQTPGTISITTTGAIKNDKNTSGAAGQIVAENVAITAHDISNQGGNISQTGSSASAITAVGNLDNTDGTIATNATDLIVTGSSINNTKGQIIHAGSGKLTVTAANGITNTSGKVATNGQMEMAAAVLQSTVGTLTARQDMSIKSASLVNDQGTISAGGGLNISGQNELSNQQGAVEAGKGLSVTAQVVNNQKGSMTSLDTSGLVVNATQNIDNTSGIIGSNGEIKLTASNLDNTSGKLTAGRNLIANASQNLNNAGGLIAAQQDITIDSGTALTNINQGSISAGGNLAVTARTASNNGGSLIANQDISLTGDTVIGGGKAIAGRDMNITASGSLQQLSGGEFSANRNASITADSFTSQGSIIAVENLKVNALHVTNDSGARLAGGTSFSIDVKNEFTNKASIAGSTLTIQTAKLNNSGIVAADTLNVSSDTLNNTGSGANITANKTANITLSTLLNNADGAVLYNAGEAGALNVTTGTLTNSGTIASASAANLLVQDITSTGILGAGIKNDGTLGTAGNLNITASGLVNANGKNLAAGNLEITGIAIGQSGASTFAGGNATFIATAGDINNTGGLLQANGAVTLQASGAVKNDRSSLADGHIEGDKVAITANDVSNQSGSIVQTGGAVTLVKAANALDNTGGTIETNGSDLSIQANSVKNDQGKIVHAGIGLLHIAVQSDLKNSGGSIATNGKAGINAAAIESTGGKITAGQSMDITSASLENDQGIIATGDALNITLQNGLSNQKGTIEAGKGLSVAALVISNQNGSMTGLDTSGLVVGAIQAIDNTAGTIGGNGDVKLSGSSLTNIAGRLIAGGSLTANVSQTLDNTEGVIMAQQNVTIGNAAVITNTNQGSISARDNLSLIAGMISNNGGNLTSNQDINLTGDTVIDGGKALAGRDIFIQADNSFQQLAGGALAANRDATIHTGNFTSGGSVTAVRSLQLTADSISNDIGAKLAGGADLNVKANGQITNKGALSGSAFSVVAQEIDNSGSVAADTLTLSAETVTNTGSQASIIANQSVSITAVNAVNNTDGALLYNLATSGALTIQTGTLTNSGAMLSARDANIIAQMVNSTGAIGAGINSDGTLGSIGNLIITAKENAVLNGRNLAAENMTITANVIDLTGAKSAAGKNVAFTASAGNIDNANGALQTNGTAAIKTSGILKNDNGTIQANTLTVEMANLSNRSGKIMQTGTVDTLLKATAIDNTSGTIAVNSHSLSLEASTLTNAQGNIIHAGAGLLQITGQTNLDNTSGLVRSNGTVDIAANVLVNTKGTITGQQDLELGSIALSNDQGAIAAAGTVTINAQNGIGNQQGIIEAGKALTISAQSLANQSGSITSLDHSGMSITAVQNINNSSGTIGANGDVILNAAALVNNTGKVLAQGNINANVSTTMDNTGGKLTAQQDVNIGKSTAVAAVTNTQGSISAGGNLLVNVIAFTNEGGTLAGNGNITSTVGSLNGAGTITAGQDFSFNLSGDFTYGAGSSFVANRDLNFNVANFTNNGSLSAVRNLNISADSVNNGAGAALQGGAGLNITASGNITNGGTMQGGNANISGLNIINSGAIFAGNLTMTADTISNVNNTAVIATTGNANLFAKTSLENKDDATIYSMGDVIIAGSKNQDGNGEYTDRTNSVLNQSATIETDGNITINADDIMNKTQMQAARETVVSDVDYSSQYPTWWLPTDHPQLLLLREIVSTITVKPISSIGRIVAGGNVLLRTNTVTNDNSQLLAAGILNVSSGATVNNYSSGNVRVVTQYKAYAGKDITSIYKDTVTEQIPGSTSLFGGGKQVNINAVNVNNHTVTPGTIQTGNIAGLNSSGRAISARSAQSSSNQYNAGVQAASAGTAVAAANVSSASAQITSSGQTTEVHSAQAIANSSTNTISIQNKSDNTAVNTSGVPLENLQTLLPAAKDSSTVAVRQTVDINITLPANGMYKAHTEPNAHYLVETDSRFTTYGKFVSSDYMLQRLGIDPEKTTKRLGDAFYEQKLVREQVTELTGRYTLSGYSSAEEQYKDLLNNGATYAKEFNLQVGVALTADQMSQLTSDMVWLVEKEVDGQKVLVPQVYLAKADSMDLKNTGALIVADNVQINASGNVDNAGTIKGSNSVQIAASNVTNYGGKIEGGKVTKIDASQDLLNFSGIITGEQVGLTAGHDIKSETVAFTSTLPVMTSTVASKMAEINATQNLLLQAGQDISLTGAKVSAGQDISITAGRNLSADSVGTQERIAVGSYLDNNVKNLVTSITAGNNAAIVTTRDIIVKGAQVNAGNNLTVVAGGNINLSSVKDEAIHDQTVGIGGGWKRTMTDDQTVIGTTLQGGGKVTVVAVKLPGSIWTDRGNITVAGSTISSQNGGVNLIADKDITLQQVTEKHESLVLTHTESRGFFSSTTHDTEDYSLINEVKGSTISGDTVTASSGNNLMVQGSTVVGTNDVALIAANNVNIISAKETGNDEHYSYTKKSGLFSGGGLGITIGSRSEKVTTTDKTLDEIGSTIGSVGGSIAITAGNQVNSAGTSLIANKDINILGKDVTIDNTVNTVDSLTKYEFKQSGLTVSLGGGIAATGINAYNNIQRSSEVQDDRLKALYDYRAAGNLKDIKDQLNGGLTRANLIQGVNISVSIGSSQSISEQSVHTETVNTSNITAGNDVNVIARDGDINLKGTKIDAANVALAAAGNINIGTEQNKQQTTSASSSSSWSVGGNIGVGFTGSFSKGSSNENGDVATNVGSVINASGTVSLNSGKDTNITGSQVKGSSVIADIGGNLNIASVQDIDNYTSKSQNSGFGGITGHTGGVTGSFSKGKADSNYASVTEQAGIYAAKDGFDIQVGKNTDLKGAVIASTATPDKNKLSTGSLTYSDIKNHADYNASSVGVNVNTSKDAKLNEKGITPDIGVPAKGDSSSTTKSAISLGTIEIRNNPKQDISNLSRDTSTSLNKLNKIFDKAKVQEKQELAKLFGELAYEEVHKISDRARQAAKDEYDKAKENGATDEQLKVLQSKIDSWKDGGSNKIALHALVGGIMSDLGGSGFLSGAVGAGVNEAVQGELAKRFKDNPDGHQWASALVGSVASTIVGGSIQAGASTAASGTKNNFEVGGRVITANTGEEAKDEVIGAEKKKPDNVLPIGGVVVGGNHIDEQTGTTTPVGTSETSNQSGNSGNGETTVVDNSGNTITPNVQPEPELDNETEKQSKIEQNDSDWSKKISDWSDYLKQKQWNFYAGQVNNGYFGTDINKITNYDVDGYYNWGKGTSNPSYNVWQNVAAVALGSPTVYNYLNNQTGAIGSRDSIVTVNQNPGKVIVNQEPSNAGGKTYTVNGETLTENQFAALRQKAVNQAWKQEKELVETTGKGTREWTEAEKQELLTTGKVKGYEGQHMKSAEAYPDQAGNPNNIQFLKGRNMDVNEHLDTHGGNYKNPTNGYYDPQTGKFIEFGDYVPGQ